MKTTFKIAALVILSALTSCKKDKDASPEPDPVTPVETGSLQINFENTVDSAALVFGQNYTNQNGDTFKVTKFNYIISNIVITRNDNVNFTEAASYHIIRHDSAGSNLLTLSGVPAGAYKSISFMLGVDSVTNASGAKTGALDLTRAGDMYWDWSTGYIALKFEGTSPKSGAPSKKVTIHTGGYGGVNKAQRVFNLSFGSSTANVSKTAMPLLHLSVDVNEIFKTPSQINFGTQFFQMTPGAGTKYFADNYADMIKFEHLHNN